MYKNIGSVFVWTGVALLTAVGGRWAVSPGAAGQVSFGEFLERQFVTTVSAQSGPLLTCVDSLGSAVGASSTIRCSGSGAPSTWIFTGLPPGLQKGTGTVQVTVEGTPTQEGTYNVTFRSSGLTCVISPCLQPSGSLTIVVAPRLAVRETAGFSLPNARVGVQYAYSFGSTGGRGQKCWATTSNLSGLVLSESGVLSGVPRSAGNIPIQVTVTDLCRADVGDGAKRTATSNVSLLVTSATTPLTVSCNPTDGPTQVGTVFVAACSANGGSSPYFWSVTGAPAGIALNTTSGSFVNLGGAPTSTGSYLMTVRVTDSSEQAATQTFAGIIASATPPPSIACNPSEGPTQVGIAYSSLCSVTDGTSPYIWSVTGTPAGIGLNSTTGASVTLAGTPTTVGPYFATLTLTDNRSLTATKTFSGNIATSEPSILNVSPNSLTFSARQGQVDILSRSLSIFAGAGSTFTVTTSGGSWLSATPRTGQTPGSVNISVSPGSLSPGTYTGSVLVSVPGSTPSSFSVPVSLTIQPVSATPSLAVSPSFLTFTSVAGGVSETRQVFVNNPGGGTLNYTVLSGVGAPWLRVGSQAGSVGSGLSSAFEITANPSGLLPGTYQSSLDIRAGTETRSVPVTLLVSGQLQSMVLTRTGIKFTALARGVSAPTQSFGIVNTGVGAMNWRASATTFTGGNWLRVSPAEGTSQGGSANIPLVTVAVDPTALVEGQYFGTIQVQAPGAGNSPQILTVLLDVLGDSKIPPPVTSPTGVILFSDASSLSRTVTISNVGRGALTFNSLTSTEDAPNWLTQSPASGTVPAGGSLDISLRANASGLISGVRLGVSRLAFSDGSVQELAIAFVIPAQSGPFRVGAKGDSLEDPLRTNAVGTCSDFVLVPTDGVQSGANLTTSQSQAIKVEVRSCSNQLLDDVDVFVDFYTATGATSDTSLTLKRAKVGTFEGTWTPRRTDTVSVRVIAARVKARGVSKQLDLPVKVISNPNTLQPRADGVFNSASYRPEQVIAPGSWTSIFGEQLADGQQLASTVPFPVSLQATEVKLAGIALPVYFVNATQVNALVPWELNPNTTQSLQVVRRGSTAATPLNVSVADRSPGIYTATQDGQGQGAIVIAGTGTLVAPTGSGSRPASRGEYIEIYATGLGPVTNTPANGAPAPSREPLARTTLQPVITIGGVTAQPIFSGLAPGFVGLYQVNVQVPANAPVGNQINVSLAIGNAVSNTVSIAIR